MGEISLSSSTKDRLKAQEKYGHLLAPDEHPLWFDGLLTILTNKRLVSLYKPVEKLRDITKDIGKNLEITVSVPLGDISTLVATKVKSSAGVAVTSGTGGEHFFASPVAAKPAGLVELQNQIDRAKRGEFPEDLSLDSTQLSGWSKVKQEGKERKLAETEEFGDQLCSEIFGTKSVTIFSKGYVRVSGGLGLVKGEPEKLLDVFGESDITKKTGLGRAATAVFTGGANLVLSPNQRGNLYLTISTDKQTHSLFLEMPKASDIKAMNKIVSAGKGVLHATTQSSPAGDPKPGGGSDLPEQLQRLSQLKDQGVLSEEEFAAAKAKLLGN